jgi:DUF1009 family protein
VIAEALRGRHPIYCAAVKGHCDENIASACREVRWVRTGQIGAAIALMKKHGVRYATMAGKIHKVSLFQKGMLWQHFPDWTGLKTFAPQFFFRGKDRKDDTILTAIVDTFARSGITMLPATTLVPELIMPLGCLTSRAPSGPEMADIRLGWRLARELGRLDVGQSVAVCERAPIAVEAIEGTDQCIARAGTLCGKGFTLVKVAKPQQDMRFDVPTIGLGTIRALAEAGGTCLAVEANKTILVDGEEVIDLANRHRIAIAALSDAEVLA